MFTKIRIIGISVVAIVFVIMYFLLSHYKNGWEDTKKEVAEAKEYIELLHNDLYSIIQETNNFNKKVEKIEELKNESYNNTKEEYRTYSDVVLPADTRLLIKQARESASNKAD